MENILLEDVAKLAFVSAPTLGPDGSLLAYTVTTSDRENNCYQANIHLCDTQTGATRALGDTGKDGAFLWDDADTLLDKAIDYVENNPAMFPEYDPKENIRRRVLIKGGFIL